MGTVVLDDKEWRGFFKKVFFNLKNPMERLKTLANTLGFKNIIEHFKNQEGPEGRWLERKPSTQLAYFRKSKHDRRYQPSNRLLQLTGNLRKSLLPNTGGVETAGQKGVLMFTTVPYAGIHNYGGKRTPKREFMWLNSETQQKMVDLLLAWVADV